MANTINKAESELIKKLNQDLMDININETINNLKYAAQNIKREMDTLLGGADPDYNYAGCLLEHTLAITDTITLLHNFESKMTRHNHFVCNQQLLSKK